jgi:ubiquitin carboxyl-terminal hydrolase 7
MTLRLGKTGPRFASICLLFAIVGKSRCVATVSFGLQNLGNTCYMNAQLQCAYHIPKVRNLIKSVGPPSNVDVNITDDNKPYADYKSESVALKAIRRVFVDMERTKINHFGATSTKDFCKALDINVYEQQDAQEFWKLLLPAINLQPLTDLYQGAFEDYIVALDGSGREKRREEPFLDLSLSVPPGSVPSSLESLFGAPELLSKANGNAWRPEKGADKVEALKGLLLKAQGLPSILQLHLKRFSYDWNTEKTSKINDPFDFPLELDLKNMCEGQTINDNHTNYVLQSVLVHLGEFSSGHYYAYVRPDVTSNKWFRFNDHVVTEVTFDEVYHDAYGGKTLGAYVGNKIRILSRLRRALQRTSYGYGGRTSNAYVLQYVRQSDIPTLYKEEC